MNVGKSTVDKRVWQVRQQRIGEAEKDKTCEQREQREQREHNLNKTTARLLPGLIKLVALFNLLPQINSTYLAAPRYRSCRRNTNVEWLSHKTSS